MSQRRFSITADEKAQIIDINMAQRSHETSLYALQVLERSKIMQMSARLGVDKTPDNVKRKVTIDYEKMELVVDDEPKIITGK